MFKTPSKARSASSTVLWTIGNLLMMVGLFMVLYVGGLMATELQNAYAANGGTDSTLQVESDADAEADGMAGPGGFESDADEIDRQGVPDTDLAIGQRAGDSERLWGGSALPEVGPDSRLEAATGQTAVPQPRADRLIESEPEDVLSSVVPAAETRGEASTITRIVIPAIKVDKKVVEVGWSVQQDTDGQSVAVWDVEKYRVGHHRGSSNPGGGSNVVLAGHSGGWVYPFNDLYYLKPGDGVQLYSAGHVYDYVVAEHILVDEVGQPPAKRRENARFIEPTAEEVVTMVACWPLSGPDKFSQRIIIRAKPANG
jgi:sortase A